MNEIINTTQVECDKSTFLVDLVKHESGRLYIEIMQIIDMDKGDKQIIKINPTILNDIIRTLKEYKERIDKAKKGSTTELADEELQKIQTWYLKGVSIKDIAAYYENQTCCLKGF
ncbi:MAG: hypothetical protein K9I94_05595 [Bacteroidales bacterium]|nr:hypothetical protein [Bacteroidales bacterium]